MNEYIYVLIILDANELIDVSCYTTLDEAKEWLIIEILDIENADKDTQRIEALNKERPVEYSIGQRNYQIKKSKLNYPVPVWWPKN